MDDLYAVELLVGWIQYLKEKYDGLSINEICKAESIHLMIEPLQLKSYEWVTVDNTTVLILNSSLSDEDQRMWLSGALAEKHMKTGDKLMVRLSIN
jgi:hypothetical protein